MTRRGRSRRFRAGGGVAVLAVAATIVLTTLPRAAARWPHGDAPTLARLAAGHRPSDATLLDRRGEPLHELRTDPVGRRLSWTPLAAISPALRDAVIAVEDRRFRRHGGVDLRALVAALADAARGARPRGASTLTMQLAALLEPELRAPSGRRDVGRKWRQMRAAWALERALAKDEILEAYLNLATFRGELEGVAAAARGLFVKAPHGVDASEAWLLAALLRAPNATAERVAARACRLAARAGGADCGGLGERARASLAAAPRGVAPVALAKHVAARLLRDAPPGARVVSTLDAAIQRAAAALLREQLLAVQAQNAADGAVLVVENATGDVLAWVGSSGALSAAPDVDGVRARRQAGSTLKPFLYARALDARLLTASSRLLDAPLEIAGAAGAYRPENYDRTFRGRLSVREALASSRNVPAVRVLQQLGVEDFRATLVRLGFAELAHPDFYGESLALGTADVTLYELVGAYRALANGGVVSPLRLVPAGRDGASTPERVFSPEAAFVVTDVLSDRASRASGFGLENVLATRFWSAVKTGTSKDMRDNWCVGFSRDYTVGVWVGNASGAPMWRVSGVDGAAPAWSALLSWLQRDASSAAPGPPPGLVRADDEWFLAGTEPPPGAPLASPSAAPTRIASPADGTVIALDPDVPPARERLAFHAEPPDPALAFALDGRRLAGAGRTYLWRPVRGRYELALVDGGGMALERVRFEVR